MFENIDWNVWGPPTAVMAVGLVTGLFVAFRSMGEASDEAARGPITAGGLTRDDLRTRKDALVEQLRDLEGERDKLEPEEFAHRWKENMDRAAGALRDLDAFDAAPPAPTPAAASDDHAPVSGGRRLAWVAGSLVFFVGLGLTLTQAVKPRGEDGSMTGATVDSRQARLEEAKAALEENPEDIDAAAFLAHSAIRGGDLEAGMQYVDAGRKAAPEDPRIQASLAALMIAIGYLDRAETQLDAVQATAPQLPQAWLWRGILHQGRGEQDQAIAAFDQVLELSEDAEDRRLAAILKSDATTVAAPVEPRVTGTVTLAEGAEIPDGALLFIYARRAETAAGPPLAALKVKPGPFPMAFEFTDGDMIRPGTWPEQVWLSARIDLDGNAFTEEDAPGAPLVGPVDGASPITLELGG